MLLYHVPHAMVENDANTMDAPLADSESERDEIRSELPDGIFVLTYHGSEPHVALVDRDRAPPTEHPSRGETVVLVEWHGGEDYALSVGKADGTGWELTDELVSTHRSRTSAIEAAAELFDDE